jgi:hypothetical protein
MTVYLAARRFELGVYPVFSLATSSKAVIIPPFGGGKMARRN